MPISFFPDCVHFYFKLYLKLFRILSFFFYEIRDIQINIYDLLQRLNKCVCVKIKTSAIITDTW